MRHISDIVSKPDSIDEAIVTKGNRVARNTRVGKPFPKQPNHLDILIWLDQNGFESVRTRFMTDTSLIYYSNELGNKKCYIIGDLKEEVNKWIRICFDETVFFIRTIPESSVSRLNRTAIPYYIFTYGKVKKVNRYDDIRWEIDKAYKAYSNRQDS